MKQLRILVGILGLSILSSSLWAQMGKDSDSKYGHGEDSVRCITNLSLYREYARNKNYEMALGYWKIVFDECPQASKNIYLDGVKIYKSFLNKKPDEELKNQLTDTLMLIYDRRIENYGQKGEVRGRQGSDLLRYRRNDDIKYVQQGYGYLSESVELMKEKSSKAVLPTLLSASITLYKAEIIDANKVIEDYLLVSNIVDAQIAKKPSDQRLKDLKASIDNNFVSEGPGSCETLIEFFSEEHKTKKDDPEFLSMLTSLLRARNCTNDELFFIASKDLNRIAPSAESALNIALLAQNKGRYEEAVEFYTQAINLEQDKEKKGSYYFSSAISYSKLKSYTKAREAALEAAKLKQGFGESYILIGQLYAESSELCTNNDAKNLPGAVFWVAVDMFNKAKSVDPSLAGRANDLVATYSKYFPNKEEAFFKGVNENETYQVNGCWINESTTARFRD